MKGLKSKGRVWGILLATVVLIKGKLKITKGGIFSYYEFTWPMLDRLTDKRWRELLYSSDAPKLPSWTTFIAK